MIARLHFLASLLALSACGGQSDPAVDRQTSAVAAAPAAWGQCAACHSLAPGRNGIGPSLADVHGQPAAREQSYAYSGAMRASGIVWDDAALDAYLANPRAVVPGTKMAYAGLSDPAARAELIVFLEAL